METYTPQRIKRWTRPDCYSGETWFDWYGSGVGRSRDSDALERANFLAMLKLLGFNGENEGEDCPCNADGGPLRVIVRENHWAVGWVEWISIHESDADGLRIADEARERLDDYPILDGELYSQLEDDDCAETWANCYRPSDRLEYLREHLHKPIGVFRDALAAVRGDWGAAAQLLPCPSDLIH
jgi:hypothetical protein